MKSDLPKVSVFIPTYNQKNFVQEAIESVLIQDYHNLDLIIGDDGSTDGTQEILLQYKAKYPELVKLILSENNYGITANCNNILKECTGEYIAMFAGDDIWLPGKIHKQIECMHNNMDAVLCYTRVEAFNSQDGAMLYIAPFKDFDPNNQDDTISFSYALGATGPSFVIRRSAIPTNGFEPLITNVSDWLFWIEVLTKGRAVFIDEVLAKYRRHENNISLREEVILTEHILTLYLVRNRYPYLAKYADDKLSEILARYVSFKNPDYRNKLFKMSKLNEIFAHFPIIEIINCTTNETIDRLLSKVRRYFSK